MYDQEGTEPNINCRNSPRNQEAGEQIMSTKLERLLNTLEYPIKFGMNKKTSLLVVGVAISTSPFS
jgi:hypothetical protein